MGKKIKTEIGTGIKLAKMFETTTVTVSESLNFRNNSDFAKKIRKAAMEMGGYLIEWSENKGGVK